MIRRAQYQPTFRVASALCLLILPCVVRAQVTAVPTVTMLNADTFHYDYTITNGTLDDLLVVSISVLPGADKVFNITAPSTDFVASYDFNAGFVNFQDNTPTGAFGNGTSLSGFTYDSFIAPQASTFDAFRLDLVNGGIIQTTDATVAAVPEPGSLALLCAGSAVSLLALRRRRNRSK